MSPLERRFLFVTGKGGVGKTTVSASLARALNARRSVLLAVTDPAPYQELLPGARWREEPAQYRDNLSTVHLQPEAALKEYGRLLIKPRLARQALFDNRYVQSFLAAVPGLPQWAVLGKAWYHTTETLAGAPRFDSVVFDAPATGHGFEMLRLPKVITEVAPAGLLRRDAELAWQLLQDPTQSAIVLVTLPEELPTNETIELAGRITRELALPIGAVVLNRVRSLSFDAEERRAMLPLAALEPKGPSAVLKAAATRAIQEQVQLASTERLAELPMPLIQLPDIDNPTAPLIDALTAAFASIVQT